MKNKKNILLLTLLLIINLPVIFYGQQIDNEIKKISLKLKKDKTYLDLKYLTMQVDSSLAKQLQNIPRTTDKKPYSFSSGANIQYRIVFLNKGIGLDSIYLMYIEEIRMNRLSGESFFVDESVKDDTTEVLSFKDLYTLKLNNNKQYHILLHEVEKFVEENEGETLPSLLAINPDDRNKSYMGMSSRDNSDYFDYQKIMNPHYIPTDKKAGTGIRRSNSTGKNFRIDASFSRITFSLKALDYSIGSTGFEINTLEPILNLLPLESANIFVGLRSIFRISSEKNLKKATLIDAKLMARINTQNSDIFDNYPVVSGGKPKLNLNNGFGTELNLTRLFGLPFITIKAYLSKNSFENPNYLFRTSDSTRDAYFSFAQFEGTFSFYWNANTTKTSRFRFDFGAAYFDVWKATYDNSGEITYSDFEGENHIVPVFGLAYTFVPAGNPFLGAHLRVMDTRINIGGWIKLFEFEPDNVIRFEAFSITEPLTRPLAKWESSGGLFFQLRYRYGL
jgi:hypothetical protein